MLELHNPNYSPPNKYAIIGPNDGYRAWHIYNCIEGLKTTGWFREHGQYNITTLGFVGYSRTLSFFGDNCIHILIPDSVSNWSGFDNPNGGWAAYHSADPLGLIYAICPIIGQTNDMRAITHELSETLLDTPPGNGYYDNSNNEEDADECGGMLSVTVNGFSYLVSSFWSNRLNRCFQQGDM